MPPTEVRNAPTYRNLRLTLMGSPSLWRHDRTRVVTPLCARAEPAADTDIVPSDDGPSCRSSICGAAMARDQPGDWRLWVVLARVTLGVAGWIALGRPARSNREAPRRAARRRES